MASKPKAEKANQAQPAEGCVWMYRSAADTPEGSVTSVEVDIASGSVEIMAALGWSTDPAVEG